MMWSFFFFFGSWLGEDLMFFHVFSWHPEECKEVLLTHNEKISKHVEKAQPERHMPKETHGRAHMQIHIMKIDNVYLFMVDL